MDGIFGFLAYPLDLIPYVVISILIAFAVHEFAHAFVAYKFGDPTAKNQGRLTLSPLAHLDPVGTILIFIAGFGWAKPVPVNRFFFKRPKLAGVLVSVAGPISNLLVAFIGMLLFFIIVKLGVFEVLPAQFQSGLEQFIYIFVRLNAMLFIFNLLPFPPLDGYRILEDLAPAGIRAKMTQYESFGIVIFLFLVITPLDRYTISPFLNNGIMFVENLLITTLRPLFGL